MKKLIALAAALLCAAAMFTPQLSYGFGGLGSAGGGGARSFNCSGGTCTTASNGTYVFQGPDGTNQFSTGATNSAAEYLQAIGGITGAGGSIIAVGAASNVAINFTAKGNANVNFGNSGSGQLAQAVDPGAAVSSGGQVQLTPSTASGPTKIGNATYGVNLDCGTGQVCQVGGRSFYSVVGKSGASASHTGDTNEVALATISIPANAVGANGALRITTIWSMTSSANAKTIRLRLGGAGLTGTTIFSTGSLTTVDHARVDTVMIAANSTSSQFSETIFPRGTDNLLNGGGTINSLVDMTSTQPLVISGQLANAGETITLLGYVVEVTQ